MKQPHSAVAPAKLRSRSIPRWRIPIPQSHPIFRLRHIVNLWVRLLEMAQDSPTRRKHGISNRIWLQTRYAVLLAYRNRTKQPMMLDDYNAIVAVIATYWMHGAEFETTHNRLRWKTVKER